MNRSLLISAAALAALIVPAGAQAFDNHSVSSVTVHSGFPNGDHHWRDHDRGFPNAVSSSGSGCDSRGDRGRHGRSGRDGLGCSGYGDFWAYYNPDFNRGWDSDSYNDWWHDRPDRAFPRWVQHNESCEPDRMWWSGNGWHC
jgi:hypothetical protein